MRKKGQLHDEAMMRECLNLARKGAGSVSPNPLVGAIIEKNGRVLGRGFHARFGGSHAEVSAFRAARSSTAGATLYVNLEPCNYYGKTPPCTDLIISSGITRVVVGMRDPNPRISGRGIAQLRRSGIAVETGVLQTECERMNEFFSKYMATGMPFVTMKISQTVDGRIARTRGERIGITGSASSKFVHTLRSRYDAVLVGAGTVKSDNPLLTVRDVAGRNPIRVVVDGNLSTRPQSRIYQTAHAGTILYTSSSSARRYPSRIASFRKKGVLVIPLRADRHGYVPMQRIMSSLGSLSFASVLVEGGADLFQRCLSAKIADKISLLIAPKIFGRGLPGFEHASLGQLQNISISELDGDVLLEGYLH